MIYLYKGIFLRRVLNEKVRQGAGQKKHKKEEEEKEEEAMEEEGWRSDPPLPPTQGINIADFFPQLLSPQPTRGRCLFDEDVKAQLIT